jgi:pilus assembly protein CpaD
MSNPAETIALPARPRLAGTPARTALLAAALVAGTALVGCNTPSKHVGAQQTGSLQAFKANDRHPIEVVRGEVQLEIDVPRFSPGLSPRQLAEVDAFITDYKSIGESEITVAVPSGGRNEGAAMSVLGKLRARIRGRGVDDKAIRYTPYRVSRGATSAPILVSYERYYAEPSPCGNWPDNLGYEPLNKAYEELGCAQQNNLAAVVANPRDLIMPRALTPADAARRGVVLGKYRIGEVSAAEKSKEESGSSSEVKE